MKIAKFIALAALVFSPVAFAATNLGTLGSGSTSLSGTYSGLYTDYTFTLAGSGKGTLSGTLGSTFLPPLDVQLYSGVNPAYLSPSLGFDSSPSSFSFGNLGAGTYTLRVDLGVGNVTGSMSVSGLAAPVPEAENYAMLLVGLSGVGLIGLRRSRSRRS